MAEPAIQRSQQDNPGCSGIQGPALRQSAENARLAGMTAAVQKPAKQRDILDRLALYER